jgi:hypothetical protein
MLKLPSSGQNFTEMIKNKYLYIDKTKQIYEIITNGKCFFLSRPRRFGKSVLLGTMAEIFRGRRDLFHGLWIDSPESGYDFIEYPVVNISLAGASETAEKLMNSLAYKVVAAAHENELNIFEIAMRGGLNFNAMSPGNLLDLLVRSLKEKHGRNAVILIDEYDAPILSVIDDIAQAVENRKVLHGFYSSLKTLSDQGYVHFMFVTGLTKFSKASVFSVFNNLDDLSLDPQYADICGFTVQEFDACLAAYLPGVLENAQDLGDVSRHVSLEQFREMVLGYYDGYSWDGKTRLLNPCSIINCLKKRLLGSFWYDTGTPTFLIDLIRKNLFSFVKSETYAMSKTALEAVDVETLKLAPLLFQTGYLTIGARLGAGDYLLREPNREVSEALNNHILESLIRKEDAAIKNWRKKIIASLDSLDEKGLAETLAEILREIPYEIHEPLEHYYQSVIYSFLKAWEFKVLAEERHGEGRVDLSLEFSSQRVFLFELKYEALANPKDPSSQKAMERFKAKRERLKAKALAEAKAQMENRGYAEKYGNSAIAVHKVALGLVGRAAVAAEIY